MTDSLTRPDTSLLTLDPLGPSFGAEVIGLDVRNASDEQVAALREALVTWKVLFLRGQDLTDDDQIELGRRFGALTAAHPVVGGIDAAHPEIFNLDSADPEFAFSDVWHTDVTFMERRRSDPSCVPSRIRRTAGTPAGSTRSSPTSRCRRRSSTWSTS